MAHRERGRRCGLTLTPSLRKSRGHPLRLPRHLRHEPRCGGPCRNCRNCRKTPRLKTPHPVSRLSQVSQHPRSQKPPPRRCGRMGSPLMRARFSTSCANRGRIATGRLPGGSAGAQRGHGGPKRNCARGGGYVTMNSERAKRDDENSN